MNPAGKMKPGQRWVVIRDEVYHNHSPGDSFIVLERTKGGHKIQWDNQHKPSIGSDDSSTWARNYRLDESYTISKILKAYETD